MKRLHVHVSVDNLAASIRFYSGIFAAEPTLEQADYAKWMLDDPRVNFAISKRGRAKGLDHLGIQAESAEELQEIEQRLQAADLPHLPQPNSSCCYAKSDKHWSIDPNGIAWEAFHTLGSIPTYGENTREALAAEHAEAVAASACGCSQNPAQKLASQLVAKVTGSSCC